MKKMLLAMGIATLWFSSCNRNMRNVAVPDPVMSAFIQHYPAIKDVDWSRSKGNYEAIFTENGVKKEAIFDMDGTLLRVDQQM